MTLTRRNGIGLRAETAVSTGRWFRTAKPDPDPRLRLICFPHAGGTASFFRSWAPLVPAGVELMAVRYPGREDRLLEPFAETMRDLVAPLTTACRGLLGRPAVFFGHSMGASVAYEVALRLRAQGIAAPSALLVSGRSGPGSKPVRSVARLDDAELIDDMRLIGGTDEQILDDPELRELVLPAVRADYRLVEEYTAEPTEPLTVPVIAYYGTEDPDIDAETVGAWSTVTSSTFDVRSFDGDHFYLADQAAVLVDDLFTRLRCHTNLFA